MRIAAGGARGCSLAWRARLGGKPTGSFAHGATVACVLKGIEYNCPEHFMETRIKETHLNRRTDITQAVYLLFIPIRSLYT